MWSTAALEVVEPVLEESPEVLRWQFLRNLRASRLLSPADVELIERAAPAARASDIQQMLLEQGLLTEYQLGRIRDGNPQGLVLGQYRILDEIGGGGFGQVFKAQHMVLERTVALKLVTLDYCQSRLYRDVFRREVAAVTRLNHPNVALTFDANEIDDVLFLALEFVAGVTLHTYVHENGPLPIPLARAIMLQIAQGIWHAHENGVIHRDIKPANVLISEGSGPAGSTGAEPVRVKVIDFGLARLYPLGDEPTGTLLADAGAVVGTPAFMAPEQARNFHEADARSDLYSLGCTFYYLLTAQLPFEGATCRLTLEMHANKAVRSVRDLRPDVPHGLAAVVQRLLAKDPVDRYQSAADLCAALNDVLLSGMFDDGNRAPGMLSNSCSSTPPVLPPPTSRVEPESEVTVIRAEEPAHVLPAAAQRLWLEWCVVVEACAGGQTLNVSDVQYAELYRALISTLGPTTPATAGRTTGPCDQIAVLVEPWVTLKALRTLDRASVAELWQLCQRYDSYFAPASAPKARRRWWQMF